MQPLTIYHCGFCEYEFPLFKPFPEDIMPYCPNCRNDEDIFEIGENTFIVNKGGDSYGNAEKESFEFKV